MAREVRTFRIEDWEGNIYKPEGVADGVNGANGASGGSSINSSNIGQAGSGATNTTEGVQTGDPYANNGTTIIITALPSKEKIVADVTFSKIQFGKYAVMIRAKSNKIGSNDDLMKVNTYYVDESGAAVQRLLSSTIIKAKHFDSTQDYSDIGFVTNFTGVYTDNASLRVEVVLLKNTSTTICLDSVTISRAFTAVTGTPTTVYKEL